METLRAGGPEHRRQDASNEDMDQTDTIRIGSAAPRSFPLYCSFKSIEPEALPEGMELLAGDTRAFEKLFAYRE